MADSKVNLELDPGEVIKSLKQMADEAMSLSDAIEEGLGKKSVESIEKLEESAKNGTNKVQSMFRNMGQRVKEDLKTAFDAGGVLAGAKFANSIGDGVKQVFEMERAFDRLNVRLGLSAKEMERFKKSVGTGVAQTGASLDKVLPGVENFVAKGGMQDPGQLSSVAKILGQVQQTTGEDVTGLSDDVIDILKNQNMQINEGNVKSLLDVIQGTRASGAFTTAGDAAASIEGLSSIITPEMRKSMGLSLRDLGGLSAAASTGGDTGNQVLEAIMKDATTAGGRDKLSSILGVDLFDKNGQMDVSQFQNIDKKRFGQYSEQVFGGALNVDQAALNQFFDAMSGGMDKFKKVATGTNESQKQFDMATDNFLSSVDKFKQRTVNAGRQLGAGIQKIFGGAISGDIARTGEGIGDTAGALWDNKGDLLGALGLTAGAGMLAGGGLRKILGKTGGGIASGIVGGAAADAMGVQKVYVTNAHEMGGAGGSLLEGLLGGGKGKLGSLAGKAGRFGIAGLAVGGAAAAGAGIGHLFNQSEMGKNFADWGSDQLMNLFGPNVDASNSAQMKKSFEAFNGRNPGMFSIEEFTKAVEEGTIRAKMKEKQGETVQMINPSALQGQRG